MLELPRRSLTHFEGHDMSERVMAVVYLEDGTWVATQKIPTALMWWRKLREPPDPKDQADKGSDMYDK